MSCTAAKLPARARPAVAAVTDGSTVPGNVVAYVVDAGSACNRPFLTTTIARSMTDASDGPALTAPQAACAAPRAVAAVLRLDPTKVSTNPDDNEAVRATLGSMDGCVPFASIVDQSLRSSVPSITPAQLTCIHSKSAITTWAQMAAAGGTRFSADLQAASKACGVH
jgi:hypothetical protein